MPARSEWKGFLQVHQLQIPVKAFSAANSRPEITLNQLHRDCGERIRQQRYCPQHGPIDSEDIVPGYEVAEGYYLPLDSAELEQLKPEPNKTIAVECFVEPQAVDPVFHSGRTLYVVPDGPAGQRPFSVLREGMRMSDRHAFSRIVLSRHEQLVLLRPCGRLLAMTVITYPHRIRSTADYESEADLSSPSIRELDLIRQLIDTLTSRRFDLSTYRDRYLDDLSALIEQRVASADLMAPSRPAEEPREESDDGMVAMLEASLRAAGVPEELPAYGADGSTHAVRDAEPDRKLA